MLRWVASGMARPTALDARQLPNIGGTALARKIIRIICRMRVTSLAKTVDREDSNLSLFCSVPIQPFLPSMNILDCAPFSFSRQGTDWGCGRAHPRRFESGVAHF